MRKLLWPGVILAFVGAGQSAEVGKVGQEVIESIQAEGEANVVIALVKPPALLAAHIDLPALNSEIASLRGQVLSSLDTSEYRERYRYQSIPALAGRLTETGLAKLIANPNVVRIDLDIGGTGSR